jgi:hypothetical protein
MEVNFEQYLYRSHQVGHFVDSELEKFDRDELNWKEHPEKWSIIEVIEHLNLVYQKYIDNFEKYVEEAPPLQEDKQNKKRNTILGRLSIFSMKPRDKMRLFKMKTFDFYEPVTDDKDPEKIFLQFFSYKNRFNDTIREARKKDMNHIKMPTAIEKVKFLVPECMEFIIAHEERHIIQIQNIISKMKSARKEFAG